MHRFQAHPWSEGPSRTAIPAAYVYVPRGKSPYVSQRLFVRPYRAELAALLDLMGENRRRHLTADKWHIAELVKHTHAQLAKIERLRDAAAFWSPIP